MRKCHRVAAVCCGLNKLTLILGVVLGLLGGLALPIASHAQETVYLDVTNPANDGIAGKNNLYKMEKDAMMALGDIVNAKVVGVKDANGKNGLKLFFKYGPGIASMPLTNLVVVLQPTPDRLLPRYHRQYTKQQKDEVTVCSFSFLGTKRAFCSHTTYENIPYDAYQEYLHSLYVLGSEVILDSKTTPSYFPKFDRVVLPNNGGFEFSIELSPAALDKLHEKKPDVFNLDKTPTGLYVGALFANQEFFDIKSTFIPGSYKIGAVPYAADFWVGKGSHFEIWFCKKDCKGVCNGTAVVDCKGQCGGTNSVNSCNICTTDPNEGKDCAGQCGGTAVKDCAGTCNGTAKPDCAGVCNGTGAPGCDGVCNSGKVVDDCGACDGGNEGKDCAGVCGGNATHDFENVCCLPNQIVCGKCFGEEPVCGCGQVADKCNRCPNDPNYDPTADPVANPDACTCPQGQGKDDCGVCGGNNKDKGCDGVCFSAKVKDACGVCGGNSKDPAQCKCSDFDATQIQFRLDGLAGDQNNLTRKVALSIRNLLNVEHLGKAEEEKIRAQVKAAVDQSHDMYLANWLATWSLASIQTTCPEGTSCTSVSNVGVLSTYEANSVTLHDIIKDLIKTYSKLRKSNSPALHKRNDGLLAKAQAQVKEFPQSSCVK